MIRWKRFDWRWIDQEGKQTMQNWTVHILIEAPFAFKAPSAFGAPFADWRTKVTLQATEQKQLNKESVAFGCLMNKLSFLFVLNWFRGVSLKRFESKRLKSKNLSGQESEKQSLKLVRGELNSEPLSHSEFQLWNPKFEPLSTIVHTHSCPLSRRITHF